MHWASCVLLANLLTSSALTPEHAVQLAERELHDFPDATSLRSGKGRYKKITPSSLQMSKRNALIRKALEKLDSTEEHLINEVRELLSDKFQDSTNCLRLAVRCTSASKYRTMDGTCNNLANPLWGSTGSPLVRLIPSRYGNSDSSPQTRGTFKPTKRSCLAPGVLPNPRVVSTSFSPDQNVPSSVATLMLVQMGQFLDHDLSFTPEAHVEHCCDDGSQHGCSPISIPGNDNFYSRFSQTCMEFTRSEHFCDSSPREQFNTITSYIDASNVYGSQQSELDPLLESNGYLLKVTRTPSGKDLLPKNNEGKYVAGDVRALDMPGLLSMHTLFVREHNRIARAIQAAFPRMSKETIFQETRRIVGAEMQNVVYGQFVPSMLGPNFLSRYRLNLAEETVYEPGVNADISNVFATAGFRFGHSMLQKVNPRTSVTLSGSNSTFKLRDAFGSPSNYEANDGAGMEEILFGITGHASQKCDRLIVDDVTNHLFNRGAAFGTDLMARNIARGRDHGLPTYGFWRRHCRLSEICSWENKPRSISQRSWDILRKLYSSPNDIDLFTAGLAETPISGSVLGETFSCVIGSQFSNSLYGDRYFFTHKGQSGSFNARQIGNLKTRSLGQILCDNTDIPRVRSNVFRLDSPWIDCPSTSTLNINLFVGRAIVSP